MGEKKERCRYELQVVHAEMNTQIDSIEQLTALYTQISASGREEIVEEAVG